MVRALSTIKGYYDYGMFRPIQIAAIMALRHTDAAVEAQAAVYQRRRDVLCDGLERIGWPVERPKASMFVWAKIPEPWAVADELVRLRHEAARGGRRGRQSRRAASARPARATCAWPWSRTKTGSARRCGRSDDAWGSRRGMSRTFRDAQSVSDHGFATFINL